MAAKRASKIVFFLNEKHLVYFWGAPLYRCVDRFRRYGHVLDAEPLQLTHPGEGTPPLRPATDT